MGCSCNPTRGTSSSSSSASNVDQLVDAGPIAPSSSGASGAGPDHLASAIAGASAYPAGSLFVVTGFAVSTGAIGGGLVRAGFNAQYSFDSGGTWHDAAGAGTAVYTAIDDTNPAYNMAMAATPIDVSGQASVMFRLNCFNGVGAASAATFNFTRVAWVYSPVNA
jgi:hypothetical protein